MKKHTTTAQINAALADNLLQVAKVECYNKSTHQTTTLDNNTFTESLQYLNESSSLADCIGWNYERNPGTDREYIFETGRMNPECDVIVTVWMRIKDGVGMDELEKMLLKEEED